MVNVTSGQKRVKGSTIVPKAFGQIDSQRHAVDVLVGGVEVDIDLPLAVFVNLYVGHLHLLLVLVKHLGVDRGAGSQCQQH